MTVLLTGATGFVGMEVLARLLERGEEVVAVVRASDRAAAEARIDDTLSLLWADPSPYRSAVRAVPGDLSVDDLEPPAGGLDAIAHCAASISFTLPIDEARAINVDGTKRVLSLARETGARAVHVSTAYVAGRRGGRFDESADAEHGPFRNTYEQSKREAELLVEAADDVDSVTARPSIIVGESATGWTPAFNVLYWPLRAFARGLLDPVPAVAGGRVDVVPVDYVADGVVALLDTDAGGRYHLVAGDGAPTVADLIELTCTHMNRPLPHLVDPGAAAETAAGDHADVYVPYFDVDCVFDAARGHDLIGPPPALASYFGRLLDYANSVRWGKRRSTRPTAAQDAGAVAAHPG